MPETTAPRLRHGKVGAEKGASVWHRIGAYSFGVHNLPRWIKSLAGNVPGADWGTDMFKTVFAAVAVTAAMIVPSFAEDAAKPEEKPMMHHVMHHHHHMVVHHHHHMMVHHHHMMKKMEEKKMEEKKM